MLAYLHDDMQPATRLIRRSYLARFALATALQAFVIWVSLFLVPSGPGSTSLIWPVSAVGLAILWFGGLELWPAIAAAFFIALLPRGTAPPLVAITALGNACESLVGAYLLRTYLDFDPMLARLRDSLGFILAACVSSLASASIISLGVAFISSQPQPSQPLWIGLWVGHTVSLLSFGPFVMRWVHKPRYSRTWREVLEGTAIIGSIVIITTLLMWTPYTQVGGISLLYIDIIPLIIAALRMGPRGMSLAMFLFAIIISTGTLFGPAALHNANLAQTLFGIQMVIGVLSLIFLLFNSITEERKEAVISLQAHVGQLEEALQKISTDDQAKTDFIAILAHELRNPLSPIVSSLELMKHNGIRPENQPHVTSIASHINTMARLLDDLLDISRITLKRFKLQKEPVEVRSVISHALETVRPYIDTRKHTLTVELPQEEIWLSADPVRLGQILVNLLNNAAKYTPEGGRIELSAGRVGEELHIRVKDNGMGIPQERLGGVFEPFGGSAPTRGPTGLRIGLSLARRMAEMHHGSLEARSAGEDKGAEFIVRIPLPANAPLPLPETTRPTRSRFTREAMRGGEQRATVSVLVVDDNHAAADNLGRLLQLSGHTVWIAYDAPQALEIATRERPTVGLLDIGLPTMDGYELAVQMRAALPEILLVALTGFGQSEDKQKAKAAGFSEHMVKPASIVDVERVLKDLTG